MTVLQLTAHFRPNVGGVETHLNDLVIALIKRKIEVVVLTYSPLTTNSNWKVFENEKGLSIIRIPWLSNLFYLLISFPILEFIYLLPGLFLFTPLTILLKNPDVIHAHGLVAGFTGVFWGRLFGKKVVVSTHSIYSFPKSGLYRGFVIWIFNHADYCMGLSKKATEEILSLGINNKKVKSFTYWIDLDNFRKIENAKKTMNWDKKFIVLFVGRLVKEKGLSELLQSVKNWHKNIKLVVVGSGPLEQIIKESSLANTNIEFVGLVNQDDLPIYYSGADILVVPSTSEEGFGRVILESFSCGTPAIGSNRGAISEVITKDVGKLIDVNPQEIKDSVEYFYQHKDVLRKMAENCRKLVERRYSEKNVEEIIDTYKI